MVAEDENGQIRKHVENLKASEILWDIRCEGSCVSAVLKHLREGERQVAFAQLSPQLSLCLAIYFLCSCDGAE